MTRPGEEALPSESLPDDNQVASAPSPLEESLGSEQTICSFLLLPGFFELDSVSAVSAVADESISGVEHFPATSTPLFDAPATATAPSYDDGLVEESEGSAASLAYLADAPASVDDAYWAEWSGESAVELAASSVSDGPEAVPFSASRNFIGMDKDHIPVWFG